MSIGEWYLLEPEELESKRIDLTLGLRSGIRFYNDLLAPGVGRTEFVRQYTWSCFSLRYARELKQNAITLANSLEALGLKAHYDQTLNEGQSYGYRGSLAFRRSNFKEERSFKGLSKGSNYVQNTYRQNTSRALRKDTGLGLVEQGNVFQNYILSESGQALAEMHNHIFKSYRFVDSWIKGELGNSSFNRTRELFGPIAHLEEKKIFQKRLESDCDLDYLNGRQQRDRRIQVMNLFNNLKNVENSTVDLKKMREVASVLGMEVYLRDLNKAVDFFEIINGAQVVLKEVHRLVSISNGRLAISNNIAVDQINKLKFNCERFLINDTGIALENEAEHFSSFLVNSKNNISDIIHFIIQRDQRVLLSVDSHIIKGPLFRDNMFSEEDKEESIPSSIISFYNLWEDAYEK